MAHNPHSMDPATPEGRRNLKEAHDELKGKMPEETGSTFIIVPDRYYLAMWFMNTPEQIGPFGRGGDLNLLVWRKVDEPTHWYVRWRFRYYQGPDAFDGMDVKKWYNAEVVNRTEEQLLASMADFFVTIGALANEKADVLWIRGDDQAFFAALKKEKPKWMQMKTMSMPAKGTE